MEGLDDNANKWVGIWISGGVAPVGVEGFCCAGVPIGRINLDVL